MTSGDELLVFDKAMKGVEVYTAFDLEQFKRHAQYRHLEKLRERLEKRQENKIKK